MNSIKSKKIFEYFRGYFSVIAWCIPFSWRASGFYTLTRIIASIIIPFLTIAITFIGKSIINLLAGDSNIKTPLNTLLVLFVALLLITLFRKIIQGIMQYCQVMHGELMSGTISLMVMDRSLNADLEYFDNPAFNDKLTSANQDSHAIASILWNVISAIGAIVSFISVLAIICQANILYSIVLIVSAVPSSLAAAKFTQKLYKLSLDQINEQRKINYTQGVATDKRFAQEVRLFSMGDWLKQRYSRIWQSLLADRRKTNRERAFIMGMLECLPEVVITLISIDIALSILNGKATLGDYTLYTMLIGQLWNAVYVLSSSAMEIYGNRLKIDNIKSLEKFKCNTKDDGILKLDGIETITFDRVCFAYPGTDNSVLCDVSFKLRKEEKIALVGLNGSGKSTLIKLLLRMYDPDSGAIYINNVNIKKYKISELRANFSVYFQEMLNYGFSLRDNFIISDIGNEASDSLIESALAEACFLDVLDLSPKRHDVSLMRFFDPKGIELSGGQLQKLALARVFYRRHSALILDEPSSNLDPMAEKKVFESLQTLTDGKMTIFTSHRLSNIYLADRIIVLEGGRVVEDGTHLTLLQNNQRYAELFRYKQEKYNSIS